MTLEERGRENHFPHWLLFLFNTVLKARAYVSAEIHIQQCIETDRQDEAACWKTFRYPFHCCSLSLLLDHGVSTFWITSSAFPPGCPSVHRGAVCVASLC